MLRMVLPLALLGITPAHAGGVETGEALHELHCTRCHGSDIYTREKRIVNSYAELAERVRQCELSSELSWFDEEISAVVDYLNSSHYHFEK